MPSISETAMSAGFEVIAMSGSVCTTPSLAHQVIAQADDTVTEAFLSAPSHMTPQSGVVPAPALAGGWPTGACEPFGPQSMVNGAPGPATVMVIGSAVARTVTVTLPSEAVIWKTSSLPVILLTGHLPQT